MEEVKCASDLKIERLKKNMMGDSCKKEKLHERI